MVECASVQGQVHLKYDAWQREFQVCATRLRCVCEVDGWMDKWIDGRWTKEWVD